MEAFEPLAAFGTCWRRIQMKRNPAVTAPFHSRSRIYVVLQPRRTPRHAVRNLSSHIEGVVTGGGRWRAVGHSPDNLDDGFREAARYHLLTCFYIAQHVLPALLVA